MELKKLMIQRGRGLWMMIWCGHDSMLSGFEVHGDQRRLHKATKEPFDKKY